MASGSVSEGSDTLTSNRRPSELTAATDLVGLLQQQKPTITPKMAESDLDAKPSPGGGKNKSKKERTRKDNDDSSSEDDEGSRSSAAAPVLPTATETDDVPEGEKTAFPILLHEIVSDPNTDSCIHWLSCGTRFMISDKKKFASTVLPRFYGHAKFTSFTRRLKRWSFTRVPSGPFMGAYYNPNFRRGEPQLAARVRYDHPAPLSGAAMQLNKAKLQAIASGSGGAGAFGGMGAGAAAFGFNPLLASMPLSNLSNEDREVLMRQMNMGMAMGGPGMPPQQNNLESIYRAMSQSNATNENNIALQLAMAQMQHHQQRQAMQSMSPLDQARIMASQQQQLRQALILQNAQQAQAGGGGVGGGQGGAGGTPPTAAQGGGGGAQGGEGGGGGGVPLVSSDNLSGGNLRSPNQSGGSLTNLPRPTGGSMMNENFMGMTGQGQGGGGPAMTGMAMGGMGMAGMMAGGPMTNDPQAMNAMLADYIRRTGGQAAAAGIGGGGEDADDGGMVNKKEGGGGDDEATGAGTNTETI